MHSGCSVMVTGNLFRSPERGTLSTLGSALVVVVACLLTCQAAARHDVWSGHVQEYEHLLIEFPDIRLVLPRRNSYIAACVVAKDVHPDDVTEWLVHHVALGVGHIYWYDHNSTVDISRRLAPFVQAGLLTLMRIRNVRDVQIGMYDHCLTSFGGRHEWLMMFDSDEFLYLKDVQTQQMEAETAQGGMHYPLHTFLQQYEDYAALGVNWVLYGSNGHQTRPQDTMMRSYTRCVHAYEGKDKMVDWYMRHIKTIVHSAHMTTPFLWESTHHGNYEVSEEDYDDERELTRRHRERAMRGTVDAWFRSTRKLGHLTESPATDQIMLLHFVLRSREEFNKKIARGGADGQHREGDLFETIDPAALSNCSVLLAPDNHV